MQAWIPVVSWSLYFWKNVFSFQIDSNLKSDGNFISNWKFPDCVHFFGAWATQAMIETIAVMYKHMKRTLEMCSPIGHNNTKHFLGPIRSRHPLEVLEMVLWESVPRGLFCPYLKTFVPPFLLTRLTAPGSPRMTLSTKCVLAFIKYKKRIWCAYRTLFHFSIKFPFFFPSPFLFAIVFCKVLDLNCYFNRWQVWEFLSALTCWTQLFVLLGGYYFKLLLKATQLFLEKRFLWRRFLLLKVYNFHHTMLVLDAFPAISEGLDPLVDSR